MENRYIDPETGKFKDSKKSEIAGGIAGGLAGSLGINALQGFHNYKQDLQQHEEIGRDLPVMQQDHARVNQALGDAELLHQMRQNPNALEGLDPELKAHFEDVYGVAERLQGRSDFDKVHELPMKERLTRFLKGKPSLEGIDPELVEYVTGRYGARPFDPEVVDVLKQQAQGIGDDIDMLSQFHATRPGFNVKSALPTLDHYKPKQLLQTVRHPLVTGGAILGVGAGMIGDEYRRHLSEIEQRHLQKEAGFSNVFKKLLPKKPPAPPKPTPPPQPKKSLLPKAVKRTGLVLGAAGVAGYSAMKAKDDFASGTKLAPSALKTEGMDKEMNKQAELYAALQKVAFDGGSDIYWQTSADHNNRGPVKRAVDGAHEMGVNVAEGARGLAARVPSGVAKGLGIGAGVAGLAGAGYGGYQLYQGQEDDIQKVAFDGGSDIYWQTSADHNNRGPVKRAVDGAHEMGVNVAEGARGLAARVPSGVAKGLGIGAGVAGLAGAGYGGYQLYQGHEEEQTAAELYAELEKVAEGQQVIGEPQPNVFRRAYDSVAGFGAGAMDKMRGYKEGLPYGITSETAKIVGKNAALGAGAIGLGVAGAAGYAALPHNQEVEGLEEEQTAAELYAELEKEAFSLNGAKAAFKGAGEKVKSFGGEAKKVISGQKAGDAKANLGSAKTLNETYGKRIVNTEDLQSKYVKERAKQVGAIGGLGAVGVGAGAIALRGDKEKTAADLYEELAKEAGIGSAIKDFGKTLSGAHGKKLKTDSAALARDGRLNKERAQKIQGKIDQANKSTRNARIGVGLGVGGTGAAVGGGMMATKRGGEQEKTASEQEQEQGNPVLKGGAIGTGVGGAIGAGLGGLGAGYSIQQAMQKPELLPDKTLNQLNALRTEHKMIDASEAGGKRLVNVARGLGGVSGGLAGGALGLGAGLAGGGIAAALANRGEQEKTAAEQEPTKGMVIDHGIDGAKLGAGVLGGMGAISGGLAGMRMSGAPIGFRVAAPIGGAFAGAASGAANGGTLGLLAGLGARHNQKGHYEAEQAAQANGEEVAAPGQADKGVIVDQSLKGAGIGAGIAGGLGALGGGALGLALKNSSKGLRAGLPIGGAVAGGMYGAGQGALIGSATGTGAYLNEKRRYEEAQGAEHQASTEQDEIEKIASETINALFNDSTNAILDEKLEKIAGYTDPLDRITFGYENLKK